MSVSAVSRPAGPAVLIKYLGYSQPDSVTAKFGVLAFERYEFSHRGHEVPAALVTGRLRQRREEERARIRGQRIGMLLQQTNLVGHLSVANNVALAQRIADGSWEAHSQVLVRCGIDHRGNARPSQLSGGELARAGVAVALANDPPVILADEPTGELDSVTADREIRLLDGRIDP